MFTRFTILGERCSGTKYLERVINKATGLSADYSCGWKHFFGFGDECLAAADDMLILGIARDPYNWLYSFKKTSYHCHYMKNAANWLDREVYSTQDKTGQLILRDKNFSVNKNEEQAPKWKNIFELRTVKLKYLVQDMPFISPNYKFINYNLLETDINLYLRDLYLEFAIDFSKENVEDFETPKPYSIPKDIIQKINSSLDWEIENAAGFNMVKI